MESSSSLSFDGGMILIVFMASILLMVLREKRAERIRVKRSSSPGSTQIPGFNMLMRKPRWYIIMENAGLVRPEFGYANKKENTNE